MKSTAVHSDSHGGTQECPQEPRTSHSRLETEVVTVPIIKCVLCHDAPLPGFRCPRCDAFTPGPRAVTGNKGAHGKAVNNRDIREALAGLADLALRRHGKHQARQARTDEYESIHARHVEHPQTRGTHRRMLSKP